MSKQSLFFLLLLHSYLVNAENSNPDFHKETFENGNPKYEISYKNELKHGKEIFWYQSGNKKMQSHFWNSVSMEEK